jgi:hypothetical protein
MLLAKELKVELTEEARNFSIEAAERANEVTVSEPVPVTACAV